MTNWTLPQTVDIKGDLHHINTDYRDILDIIGYLDSDQDEYTKNMIGLALFYKDFENMAQEKYNDAHKVMMDFIRCGELEEIHVREKTIDWVQDYNILAAEVNKTAGYEVRSVPYMHWFTFIGYFNCIGEGQLSTMVSIREKRRKGQRLEKWEQDFYRDNKQRIDFKRNYTDKEQEEINKINQLLGG